MCYRCSVCRDVVDKGLPQQRHVIYKPGKSRDIARELPVCYACYDALGLGVPLAMLIKQQGKARRVLPVPRQPATIARPVGVQLGNNLLDE